MDMINSMTGFAAAKGEIPGWSWAWDIRSVNARGLDIRMRVPDWIAGLEQALRPVIQKSAARGNINLTLKVQRDGSVDAVQIDGGVLDNVLAMLKRVEIDAAGNHNLKLAPASAAEILAMRGVTEITQGDQDTAPVLAALITDFPDLLAAFNTMRAGEGANLHKVLCNQFDLIEVLTQNAQIAAQERKAANADNLHRNLAQILNNTEGADPDRVAQELALLAVKADVTEEIDRLHAHVAAARDLLASNEPVGRKLDFLSQEFNREANTLCSKAQSPALTRIGLDLKAVIDQMREQVQNVE